MSVDADKRRELDPRIKIRAPLRCDGIGRFDCAEDSESGGRLAVRWLPLDANGAAAAKACEQLPVHPTLPRILQTGQVGGSAFVAMDFPDGQLLSTWVGDRLEVEQVLRLAVQLSDALATVHEQGVMHGELSPDSVLVVPATRALLWDLPLVIANRLTDRRGESRLMQNLTRTAPYLAPERARGGPCSHATDVYSLGAVLCVAAGAPLPAGASTLGVVHLVATLGWAPRVDTTMPDPWRSMLLKMIATDPEARPTAREVATLFAQAPQLSALPTVPDFPVVKLSPQLLAAAEALLKKVPPLDAEAPRASLTMEAPIVDVVRIPTSELHQLAPPAPSAPSPLSTTRMAVVTEPDPAPAAAMVASAADTLPPGPAPDAARAAASASATSSTEASEGNKAFVAQNEGNKAFVAQNDGDKAFVAANDVAQNEAPKAPGFEPQAVFGPVTRELEQQDISREESAAVHNRSPMVVAGLALVVLVVLVISTVVVFSKKAAAPEAAPVAAVPVAPTPEPTPPPVAAVPTAPTLEPTPAPAPKPEPAPGPTPADAVPAKARATDDDLAPLTPPLPRPAKQPTRSPTRQPKLTPKAVEPTPAVTPPPPTPAPAPAVPAAEPSELKRPASF